MQGHCLSEKLIDPSKEKDNIAEIAAAGLNLCVTSFQYACFGQDVPLYDAEGPYRSFFSEVESNLQPAGRALDEPADGNKSV